MSKSEWDAVPLERRVRLLERVAESGKRCIDCFEQLTLVERLQGRGYCTDCFPDELEVTAEVGE